MDENGGKGENVNKVYTFAGGGEINHERQGVTGDVNKVYM
jgi:hypothetical protein